MEKTDIASLKKRRESLKLKIWERSKKGKNAKDLVIEYHNLLDKLKEYGVKPMDRADYLQLSYWDSFEAKSSNPQPTETNNIIKTPTENKIQPKQDSFILCIAWSTDLQNNTPVQVSKVLTYFNELGLTNIDEEVGEIENRIEHIIKYEFKGTEEAFRMLKTCTQFVLDSFAQTDFDKFNIAIYGKKKKF